MKILVAEINPAPKVVLNQNDLFAEPEIIECNYMIALARPYALGSAQTNFEVQFGVLNTIPVNGAPDAEKVEVFVSKKSHQVNLTKEELASWGENDEVCLTLIAQKLNIACVSFKELNVQ
jgi:hypothetical protein